VNRQLAQALMAAESYGILKITLELSDFSKLLCSNRRYITRKNFTFWRLDQIEILHIGTNLMD